MNIYILFLFLLGIFTPVLTQAANLYKPGTDAYKAVAAIEGFLPRNMVPVIIIENERQVFAAQIDQAAAAKNGLDAKTLKVILNKPWDMPISSAIAYAKVINLSPSKIGPSVCLVTFKTKSILPVGLMHESMHCRTNQAAEWSKFSKEAKDLVLSKIISKSGAEIPQYIKQHVLTEVHARIMAYVIMEKTKTAGDINFMKVSLNKPFPANPGKYSIARGISLCMNNTCPSGASDLIRELIRDKIFVKSYIADVNSAYEYEETNGTILDYPKY